MFAAMKVTRVDPHWQPAAEWQPPIGDARFSKISYNR